MKATKNTTTLVKYFRFGVLLILALMLVTACGKGGNSYEP